MATTHTINKQLAVLEDLQRGRVPVSQSRGGSSVNLNPVDVPIVVADVTALQNLDITEHTRARLYYDATLDFWVDYIYDAAEATLGFASNVGSGRWVADARFIVTATTDEALTLDLPIGALVETQGRFAAVDGGAAQYLVVAPSSTDEVVTLAMTNGNTLALLTNKDEYRAEVFGIANSQSAADNDTRFERVIDLDLGIIFGPTTYTFNNWDIEQAETPVRIRAAGASKTTIQQNTGTSSVFIQVAGSLANPANQIQWENFTIASSAANNNAAVRLFNVSRGNSGLASIVIQTNHKECDGLVIDSCWDLTFKQVEVEGQYADGDATVAGRGRGVVVFGEAGQGVVEQIDLGNITVSNFSRGYQIGKVNEAGAGVTRGVSANGCKAFSCEKGWELGDVSDSVFVDCISQSCWLQGIEVGPVSGRPAINCTFINFVNLSNARKDNTEPGGRFTYGRNIRFINPYIGLAGGTEFICTAGNSSVRSVVFDQPRFAPLSPSNGVGIDLTGANKRVTLIDPTFDAQFAVAVQNPNDGYYMHKVNGTRTINNNSTTPSFEMGETSFELANTLATTITDLLDNFSARSAVTELYDGYQVSLVFANGNTTLSDVTASGGNFRLVGSADWNPNANDRITLEYYNGEWQEVCRSVLA